MQKNQSTSNTQLQTITHNQLGLTGISSDNQRVKYLKEKHHDLYGNLYKLANEQNILSVEAFQTYFHGQAKSACICTNQITYYYVCRTCQQDADYKICQLCFYKDYHKNHNYYTVQQNGDCDCGFPGGGNICSQHMQIYNNKDLDNAQAEYNSYITFLLQFLNICITMKPQLRIKHKTIINQYFNKIIKINQYNSLYIKVTAFCLNQPAQSDKFNKILFKILEINQNQLMAQCLPKLFRLLICYPAFRILFVSQTFKFKNMVYQYHTLNKVWKIMERLLKVPKILTQLTYKKIEIYPQNPSCFANIHFINIVRNMMNKNKNCIQPDTNLIVLMKMMLQQKKIIPYQLKTNYKLLQFVFTKISTDRKLIVLLISQLLRNKTYNELWTKQHDSQWFNGIVRVILCAMNGCIDKFPQFFIQIQLPSVIRLVKGYFRQVFRIKNKCKFNNLTAICLFKTAKYYNFVHQFNNLDIGNCINLKKFTDNLLIVLRNLVTNEHLSALHLLKIAQLNGDQQKIKQYKNQIMQWFRYFMQTKRQVSQKIIRNLQEQQIINFPQAIQILVNQTTYQQETKVFIWKGAITKINQDRLLSNIKQLSILEGKILYEDYTNQMFYTELRQQILLAIYGQNIKKLSAQKFLSYPKNQRYRMLLSAIILDSILKGKSQNVKDYIQKLKAFVYKMKNNDPKFHKLFQVTQDNKEDDLVKQQMMYNNNNNGPERAKQNNENLINVSKELNINPHKVQIQKQLTQHQIQTNNKRNFKMQKIKQKFNNKSQKYIHSSYHTKQKAEQEVCLICRQSQAKNKFKSFLYYLGNLKTDELTKILYGAQGQGPIIKSCFHPYHQKCILNNSNICILCKQTGNCILPVINQTIQSDLFVTAWWDDFISLNSFTPKPNLPSYYGYYSNQNQTVDQGTQTKQSQIELQLKKRRPYKNLLIIYKSLVIRLCAVAVKTKWQDSLRKNQYLFSLILAFTTKLNKNQKIQLLKQIVEFEIIIKQSKITDYLKDLTIATSYLLQNKLGLHLVQQEQAIGKAKQLCCIIFQKYPLKLISNFIKNMQWLLQEKIIGKQKQQESKPICMAELFSYIYNFDIPNTMQDLYSIRKNCKKCNRLDSWYCLICKQTGCQHCQNPYNHMKIIHKNNNSIIVLQASTGYLAEISNNVTTSHVYFDVFGNQFDQSKSLILKNYRYSKNKVSLAFNNLFKRL